MENFDFSDLVPEGVTVHALGRPTLSDRDASPSARRKRANESQSRWRDECAKEGSKTLAACDRWEEGELVLNRMISAREKDAQFPAKNANKWKFGRNTAVQNCASTLWIDEKGLPGQTECSFGDDGSSMQFGEPSTTLLKFCQEVDAELCPPRQALSKLSPQELHLLADARIVLGQFTFLKKDVPGWRKWIQKSIDCLKLLPEDVENTKSGDATRSGGAAASSTPAAAFETPEKKEVAAAPDDDAAADPAQETAPVKKSKNKKARRRAQAAAAALVQHAAEKEAAKLGSGPGTKQKKTAGGKPLRFLAEHEQKSARSWEPHTKHRKMFRAYTNLATTYAFERNGREAARVLQKEAMPCIGPDLMMKLQYLMVTISKLVLTGNQRS